MEGVERAFRGVTKILFGKELSGLKQYEGWFAKTTARGEICPAAGGEQLFVPDYSIFAGLPKGAIAGTGSFNRLSQLKIKAGQEDGVSSISKKLPEIAQYIVDFSEGKNSDVSESTIYSDVFNGYRLVDCSKSKNVAFCFWSSACESSFGVAKSAKCSFSMNVYQSIDITRSFEVDFSKNCSGVMFCHNCYNVHDSLFCFSSENIRYAICNVEVGREKFMEWKAKLSEYIVAELEKRHALSLSVYNMGCKTGGMEKYMLG